MLRSPKIFFLTFRSLSIGSVLLMVSLFTPQVSLSAAKKTIPDSRFAILKGMRVHYESYGKGKEALVFIHGWTCDLNFWKGQVPGFEDRMRMLLIDLPGHGQSDQPPVAYTMDLFAQAIDTVLKDAKVKQAVLVGHSMGTPVARQFYRLYPQKTRALIIVDGALRPYGNKEAVQKFFEPLRGPNYPQAAGQIVGFMVQPVANAALREEIKTAMLRTPQHVAVSAMDGMMEDAIWKPDPIQVPVLAIMAKSPSWPEDTESFYRRIAPKLDFQMWTGVSHFLMMEKPKEFNDAVATFLLKNGLMRK